MGKSYITIILSTQIMGEGKKIGTCEGWGMIHERLVFAQAHKKGKEPERNH